MSFSREYYPRLTQTLSKGEYVFSGLEEGLNV